MSTTNQNLHKGEVPIDDSLSTINSTVNGIHNDYYISVDNNINLLLSSNTNTQLSLMYHQSDGSHLREFTCVVCSAPAHGYNFDQITCESCKAFFRRNAFRNLSTLKCRYNNSCTIDISTRRRCTYCRLKKCFDVKMRKDWIRTEEEKNYRKLIKQNKEQKNVHITSKDDQTNANFSLVIRRKKRLLLKSRIQEIMSEPIYETKVFSFNRNLLNVDRTLLNNINGIYQLAISTVDGFRIKKCIPRSLTEFFNSETEAHESLIQFYKAIPEFIQLNVDNQILLIKSNLINIATLHYILLQNFQDFPNLEGPMSKWISLEFHKNVYRARQYFNRFIEHPLILKLTLIILLFNINPSIARNIDFVNEDTYQIKTFKAQEYYTELLWRYLNHLFGEHDAIISMQIIITKIVNIQLLMYEMMSVTLRSDDANELSELMQSLLCLT